MKTKFNFAKRLYKWCGLIQGGPKISLQLPEVGTNTGVQLTAIKCSFPIDLSRRGDRILNGVGR